MSDRPLGPDWWQASDDRWYPPPPPMPQGPPVPPPGAGGPNRTALFVTLGAVVAIAGLALIAALSRGGDDGGSQAGPSTTDGNESTTTRVVETTESPDTAERDEPVGPGDVSALEVIEEGFSTYTDPIGGAQNGSFGFLVRNIGDTAIVGAPLSVSILDEAGRVIETASFTVGVIRRGETLGYGAELIEHPTNGIGGIEVQVGESVATYDAPSEGTLTVSNVNTTSDEYSTKTTFTVSSTYSQQVDFAEPYAIYRDANGRIIGGGNGIVDFIPSGGQQDGGIDILTAIPNIAVTEVYVDPGPFY